MDQNNLHNPRPLGDNLSLADRLSQPVVGTTDHMPAYFLSDQYIGYINIIPFGIFKHISNVEINPMPAPAKAISNVEITPTPPIQHKKSDVRVNPVPPPEEKPSDVEVTPSPQPATPVGVDVDPFEAEPIVGSADEPIPFDFQPEGISPSLPTYDPGSGVDIPDVEINTDTPPVYQGESEVDLFDNSTPLEDAETPDIPLVDPTENPAIQQGTADLATNDFQSDYTPEHGEGTISVDQPEPPRPTEEIQTLSHQAGALLAIAAPRVTHGSADLVPPSSQPDSELDETGQLSKPDPIRPTDPIEDPQVLENQTYSKLQAATSFNSSAERAAVYRTLSYGELRAKASDTPTVTPELQNYETPKASVVANAVQPDSDFITIVIEPRVGEPIQLRAFLTAFSDSLAVQWKDINYIGRQDTLKAFQGVQRSVSLGVKLAAFSKRDMMEMYSNLNRLLRGTTAGTQMDDRRYIGGPICRLTLGHWFDRTLCVTTAVKMDSQPSEYAWDVGQPKERDSLSTPDPSGTETAESEQLPMLLDLSMDFVILGDVNNNLLGRAQGDFIAYRQ